MIQEAFNSDTLKGRVALITGGGSGIGFGIATAMVNAGAKVVIASRKTDVLEEAASKLKAIGGDVAWVQTDVREPEQVKRAVETAVDTFGGLDIMIANAAGNFVVPSATMSLNAWRTVIDIDLNGTFYCAQAAYPHLKASKFGGRLLAISTMRALEGWPGCAHAGAAKAGIISLIRSLSAEWGADGIRCNTIAPGAIGNTLGVQKIYEDQGDEVRRQQLAQIPLGELGRVEDIAAAAVYLCSALGDYVTGTDLVVDGGRQRRMQEGSGANGKKESAA
ncbi:SDR family oxidoreductase [Paracoccus sp. SCSIO 75233]|uniref:SDR family oxidoreductase n=1 Tax=Paracoccus sp. SCSIO 75233 TaxID=3017782 RepID=UPI0022F10614|nr:SDR family oxidoreductase [Paracoccus sp. SCSIO 75233]WBU53915.1 SDR family oxidoreductase [Paracoccus sp. SCSIO 75233]